VEVDARRAKVEAMYASARAALVTSPEAQEIARMRAEYLEKVQTFQIRATKVHFALEQTASKVMGHVECTKADKVEHARAVSVREDMDFFATRGVPTEEGTICSNPGCKKVFEPSRVRRQAVCRICYSRSREWPGCKPKECGCQVSDCRSCGAPLCLLCRQRHGCGPWVGECSARGGDASD